MTRKMLLSISLLSSLLISGVSLTVSDIDDDGAGTVILSVALETDEIVAGYQFDVISEGLLTNSGAVSGEIVPGDWMVSASETTVLGFSLMGTTITEGSSGTLVNITAAYDVINIGETVNIFAEEEGNGGNRLIISSAGGVGIEDVEWVPVAWLVGTGLTGLGIEGAMVNSFALDANYPNPFNPTTNISYSIPEFGEISLIVFDALGKEVKTLVTGEIAPGAYNAVWNGTDNNGNEVSTGMYFYKLTSGEFTQTRKMMFVK